MGDKQTVVPSVPETLFVKVYSLLFDGITGSLVFIIAKRRGSFVISDQPTFGETQATSAVQGVSAVPGAHCLSHKSASRILARLPDYTDIIFSYFAQMISVRYHLSFAIVLAQPSFR